MKYRIILAITLLSGIAVNAQIREFGNFISTGTDDARALFGAYMSPYLNGFGASLSGGWYNTAKTHKLGGFDITLSVNTAIVPEKDRSFRIDDLELNNLQRVPGSEEMSSTIAGTRESGPSMQYSYAGYTAEAFELPAGTGFQYTPAPVIHAGVGLIKGIEIMGRYVPKLGNDKGKLGLWGVGVKHDVKQWIPVLEKVPVLNISVMGAYTRLNSWIALNVNPETLNLENYINVAPETWDNQTVGINVGSFTSNLIVSADLPVITFYGGAGIAVTNSQLLLEGNYPMITGVDAGGPIVEAVNNPLDIKIKNKEGGVTRPRFNAGVRLKLALFTIHADYTWANYSMVSAGLGFSFR